MKVFVSWSKDASRAVAEQFAKWLPRVIQESEVFISTDTEKGDAWFQTIHKNLADSTVGVLFITPANKDEPWLNYEAGALRTLSSAKRLCSVFVGMKTADYKGPMQGFQMTHFSDEEDMLKLLVAVNGAADRPLESGRLEEEFRLKWPLLVESTAEAVLAAKAATEPAQAPKATRSVEEKIDEILDVVRTQRFDRTTSNVEGLTFGSLEKDLTDRKRAQSARIMAMHEEAAALNSKYLWTHAYRGEVYLGQVDEVIVDDKAGQMLVIVKNEEGKRIGHDLTGSISFSPNKR